MNINLKFLGDEKDMNKESDYNQFPFNIKIRFFLNNPKINKGYLKENESNRHTEIKKISSYLYDTRSFEDAVTEWTKHNNSAEAKEIRKELDNLGNTLRSHQLNKNSLSNTKARGNALKKSNDFECIARPTCKYPQRGNCLGCVYQINKSTNLLLDPKNKSD